MKLWLLALLALPALPLSAIADEAPSAACLIVYGHGRNIGEPPQNEAWDRINARFNAAVTARLKASGREAQPLLFKVGVTDLAAAVQILSQRAEQQGCSRVVDTAVFADENGALIVRLRVHPVLGNLGPVVALGGLPRIGSPLYTSQSEFDFTQRTLERINFDSLAVTMLEGYLAKEAAVPPVKPPGPAASRAQ